MKRSFTVHDLPPSERPRERLLRHGVEVLATHEVLVLVLGQGIRGESVMVMAQRLLSEFGNIKNIASASVEELSRINGIGPAKAAQIKAAFELGKRLEGALDNPATMVKFPEDAVKSVKNRLRGKKKEHFLAISLNTRNHVINVHTVSIGSLDSSIVHPREVFKEVISSSAASVIFIHNHPSGDTTPSKDDVQLTKRLVEAGEILGIEVLDHIIVSDGAYLSMKASNLL